MPLAGYHSAAGALPPAVLPPKPEKPCGSLMASHRRPAWRARLLANENTPFRQQLYSTPPAVTTAHTTPRAACTAVPSHLQKPAHQRVQDWRCLDGRRAVRCHCRHASCHGESAARVILQGCKADGTSQQFQSWQVGHCHRPQLPARVGAIKRCYTSVGQLIAQQAAQEDIQCTQ